MEISEWFSQWTSRNGGSLNELAEIIYQNAASKGFWIDSPNFAEKLALIHSEVSEALEYYRDGLPVNKIYYKTGKPEGVPVELIDALIRILDCMAGYEMDIERALIDKINYNFGRGYKHGKLC